MQSTLKPRTARIHGDQSYCKTVCHPTVATASAAAAMGAWTPKADRL